VVPLGADCSGDGVVEGVVEDRWLGAVTVVPGGVAVGSTGSPEVGVSDGVVVGSVVAGTFGSWRCVVTGWHQNQKRQRTWVAAAPP
jgi:hypothetical protein